MADAIDHANDITELYLNVAMHNRTNAPRMPATGFCHNCEAPVEKNAHFCDTDCRDDWQKRRNMQRTH